jgi:CO dehydrogenase maturation factor
MLRLIIDAIGKAYDYVVIDNEAGMEHLSRRTTRDVDVLLLVTDPTVRGVSTAGQMAELSRKLKINVGRVYLIVNRLDGTMPAAVQQAIERMNVPLVGIVPGDPQLAEFDSTGQPLIEIDDGSVAYRAIARIAEKILDSEVMRQRSSLSTYPLAT